MSHGESVSHGGLGDWERTLAGLSCSPKEETYWLVLVTARRRKHTEAAVGKSLTRTKLSRVTCLIV